MKKFRIGYFLIVSSAICMMACKAHHAKFYGGDICPTDKKYKGKMPKDAFQSIKTRSKKPRWAK